MSTVLQQFSSDLENSLELHVSFEIKSDYLIPKEISEQLKINPTHAFAKGETVTRPDNKRCGEQVSERPWGLWVLSTKEIIFHPLPEPHFRHLLDLLAQSKENLDYYLNKTNDYEISFRIWRRALGFSGMWELNSSLLQEICLFCHSITFHYLCSGTPE